MLHLYYYKNDQKGGMLCSICQTNSANETYVPLDNQLLLNCNHSICEKCYEDMKLHNILNCIQYYLE